MFSKYNDILFMPSINRKLKQKNLNNIIFIKNKISIII